MDVQVSSIHFKADQDLIAFIQDKVNKLTLFHDKILSGDVTLRIDKDSDRENKVVEIKLHVPGHELFSRRRSSSFEQGTAAASDALRRQISKVRKQSA
jgi:putative sigma-54 modulation protein